MAELTEVKVPQETVNDESVTLRMRAVEDGSKVKRGDLLAEIETSKANVEVEAPADGYVFWAAELNDDVAIGAALCHISDQPTRPELQSVGSASSGAVAAGATPTPTAGSAPARFSRGAKQRLQELGLDEALFAGRGLVKLSDVEAMQQGATPPAAKPGGHATGTPQSGAAAERELAAPTPTVQARSEKLSRGKRTEVGFLRRASARTVPSSVTVSIDTQGVRQAIQEHSERYGSFVAVVIHEAARLLREYPVLNAYQHAEHLNLYERVDVAVAMDAGKGLKAPVIPSADRKEIREISSELQTRLMEYLREALPVESLTGGTFTLSDLGAEGVTHFVPVLNEAQSATLGIGAELPMAEGRYRMSLTLTFDHLVTEGRTAALFLKQLGQAICRYDEELANAEPPAKRQPPANAPPPVAAGDPLLGYLEQIWCEMLELESIKAEDNFFDLGGDSIVAARLVNVVQDLADEIMHAVAIFDAPTMAEFAAMLRADYPDTTKAILGKLGVEDIPQTTAARAGAAPGVDQAMIDELRALIPSLPATPIALPPKKNGRAIFVLSPPRCGSTLLRVMLAGHSKLFAPPELELLNFDSLGTRRDYCVGPVAGKLEGLLRAVMDLEDADADRARTIVTPYEDCDLDVGSFYGEMQEWLGERLLVDKTPAYALDRHCLERAEAYFEDPLYVYLNRHPNGMVLSFEESRIDQVFFHVKHPFPVRRLAELIWNVCTENINGFLAKVPASRKMELRYEDLVQDPKGHMQRFSEFAGVEFQESMLTPYEARQGKMTDGLHDVSRMIGDPKFHKHRAIDASMAERWREVYDENFLGQITWELARSLGYKAD